MRRLNERDDDYQLALREIQFKAIASSFPRSMVRDMVSKAAKWQSRFPPIKNTQETAKTAHIVPHATVSPHFMPISQMERRCQPNAMVSYRRPPNLASMLTQFRKLSFSSETPQEPGSHPCKQCATCGKYGKQMGKPAVKSCTSITAENGAVYKIRQSLTCDNSGIYAVRCKLCKKLYTGQTMNAFKSRFTQHRTVWNKFKVTSSNMDDQASLLKHFQKVHPAEYRKKPEFYKAWEITFVEEPLNSGNLDIYEDRWHNKLKSSINIQNMILPRFK